MPRFRYSFVRPDGVIAQAIGEAESEFALAARLQREHCYLLSAGPELSWRSQLANLTLRTGQSSLVLALHELGSLVKAGLPVDRGLTVVAELFPEPRLKGALLRVRDAVRRGVSLADAMEAEPDYFMAFHVNLVRAGEAAGALDDALLRLAEHLRQKDALRGQIMVALIYPAILMLVGVAALILLATVVLPQLAPIFADAGQQMPLPTQLILDASDFLQRFGWLVVVLAVLGVMALRQYLQKPENGLRWDRIKLRLPVLGSIIMAVQTAWFARTSGTLLKAGVALPTALVLARQTVTNRAMSEALRLATIDVRAGRKLTDALQKSGVFSLLTAQLISVGEEVGHLDDMLIHQAELFERSAARDIERLVAILVPALTIVIGSSVAGVLASILLAVMKLNELAS